MLQRPHWPPGATGVGCRFVRAVTCRELGPPEDLTLEETEARPCGPGQLRVKVAAAGVNFVDGLFVQGLYQIKPPLPFVPGSEFSGTVVEIGDGVSGWAVGDRILASTGLGAFADEAVIGAGQAVAVPAGVDLTTAATIGQSYCTAWYALARRAAVTQGQSLLVLGAAGGVGLASIDVGVALGATVIAAASSPERLAAATRAGASSTIDYSTESLKDRARELSGGGVDVALDPVGGTLAEQALRSLGTGGRLLVIGFASGEIPRLPANQILLRNREVVGIDWGAWAMGNPAENATLLAEVLSMVSEGRLHPTEPTIYPLEEAGQAMRDLLDRKVSGKVALIPSGVAG